MSVLGDTNRRECSCSQLTPLSALFIRQKLVQIRQVRVLTQKKSDSAASDRSEGRRGKRQVWRECKGDEMLQEPARKGKGGALPQ